MSLVDYPSSDDDVSEEEEVRENKENEPQQQLPSDDPRPRTQLVVSSYQQQESSASSSAPSIQQLPDASMLLNSPVSSSNMLSGGDHSSHVAAAMAESSSRKRENTFASSVPRNKVPRGNLPHSKNVPDTVGGLLVPPQLRGRYKMLMNFNEMDSPKWGKCTHGVCGISLYNRRDELMEWTLFKLVPDKNSVLLLYDWTSLDTPRKTFVKSVFNYTWSNIVTEDVGKLFVKKQADPSPK